MKSYVAKAFGRLGPHKSDQTPNQADFNMGSYLHLTNPISLCKSPKYYALSIPKRVHDLNSSIRSFTRKRMSGPLITAPAVQPAPGSDGDILSPSALADPSITHPSVGEGPLHSLPDAILIRIFQNFEYEQLPTLLAINKKYRKLLLDNYHLILSYPAVITSKLEYCLLTLTFPKSWADSRAMQFYTALQRVVMHQDCFRVTADLLAAEYIRFWKLLTLNNPRLRDMSRHISQAVDKERIRDEILARLLKEAWQRGVKSHSAVKYMTQLTPTGYERIVFGGTPEPECDGETESGKETLVYLVGTRLPAECDGAPSEGLNAPASQPDILQQAVTFAVKQTIREEISYSFPGVKLEKLHPVQILALSRIKVAPWSWEQEEQKDRMRTIYSRSMKATKQLEQYRNEWEIMKDTVAATLESEIL
ncbi:hypothetical protein TWF696_001165 [Orbilia brochopaga]|uniref:F-box domain-containing protein n=1 Tax=Orbilia brochopaga TaxID=3140254 RepID=A0AAV9VDI1_9PEZI